MENIFIDFFEFFSSNHLQLMVFPCIIMNVGLKKTCVEAKGCQYQRIGEFSWSSNIIECGGLTEAVFLRGIRKHPEQFMKVSRTKIVR